MAAENWEQKFNTNPITTNQSGDLLYWARSPYGPTDDAVISWDDFVAQFLTPSTGVTPVQVQESEFNSSVDTGTDGTNYIATLTPAPASYFDSLTVILEPAHTNTIYNPSMNVNGLGLVSITGANGIICLGDILVGIPAVFIFSVAANQFILQNPANSINGPLSQLNGEFNAATDTGTSNAYVASNSLLPSASPQPGTYVFLTVLNTSSGASTFNFNGGGAFNIATIDGNPLAGTEMQAGGVSILYLTSGLVWQLLNPFESGGGGGVTPLEVQSSAFNLSSDSGSVNAYVGTYTPVVSSGGPGLTLSFIPANTNTVTNPTFDAGFGPFLIADFLGYPIALGDIQQGIPCTVASNSNGNQWIIQNPYTSLSASFFTVTGKLVNAIDNTNTNNYVANNAFLPITLNGGAFVFLLASNGNTGASTFNYNGMGAFAIQNTNEDDINPGDMIGGQPALLWFSSGSKWILINPLASYATVLAVQASQYTNGTYPDSGSANAYVVGYTPAIANLVRGQVLQFTASNANTGASTIDVGYGPAPLRIQTSPYSTNELIGGEIAADGTYQIITSFDSMFNPIVYLMNPSPNASTMVSSVVPAASAVSLSTGTLKDITSITLPNGVWQVTGNVSIGGSTNIFGTNIGFINSSSATMVDLSLQSGQSGAALLSAWQSPVPSRFFTGPITLYLTAAANFITGTASACGGIYANKVG